MPRATITTTPSSLPGLSGRKQLHLRVLTSSGEVFYGWRSDVTAADGMPLREADGILAFGGPDMDIGGPLTLVTASGSVTLAWEEKA